MRGGEGVEAGRDAGVPPGYTYGMVRLFRECVCDVALESAGLLFRTRLLRVEVHCCYGYIRLCFVCGSSVWLLNLEY